VDGQRRPKSHRLEGGEQLELTVPEPVSAELEHEDVPLRIAWEDEHILVVDKPAGVVVHPSPAMRAARRARPGRPGSRAGRTRERPGIVHWLDRDTSGLLVVARSEEAYTKLQELVRARSSSGATRPSSGGRPFLTGRIEAPIGRDRREPTRHSLDTDTPREAVTHFEVERLLDRHALLDVRLETGRTHQIRVHLAAIGLPVVGDPVYGVPDDRLRRQFLHAWRLAFPHPLSGEAVEVESPLSADLQAALARFDS
jgi:23S rRNA pseudouridine1911/1915/1917 synthase